MAGESILKNERLSDCCLGSVPIRSSDYIPFFSAKAMASSLEEKLSTMLDSGSALQQQNTDSCVKQSLRSDRPRPHRARAIRTQHPQTSTQQRQEDSRGGPAHQRVLPTLPGVKVDLPLLGAVGPGLHGRLGGHEDAHLARLDVLLGDARHRGDILRKTQRKWPFSRSQSDLKKAAVFGPLHQQLLHP